MHWQICRGQFGNQITRADRIDPRIAIGAVIIKHMRNLIVNRYQVI